MDLFGVSGAIRHRTQMASLRQATARTIVERDEAYLRQIGNRISGVRVVSDHEDAMWKYVECIDAVVNSGGGSL